MKNAINTTADLVNELVAPTDMALLEPTTLSDAELLMTAGGGGMENMN
jgi:hypothetical protein